MHKVITATLSALALSLPALVLADAGHGPELGKPGDPKKRSRAIEITSDDDVRYRPSEFIVKRGETVRLVVRNAGQVPQELVLGSLKELKAHAELMRKHPGMEHEAPNQAFVKPGQTREIVRQFTRAGTLDFAGTVPGHFEAGMTGKVVVSARRPNSG